MAGTVETVFKNPRSQRSFFTPVIWRPHISGRYYFDSYFYFKLSFYNEIIDN